VSAPPPDDVVSAFGAAGAPVLLEGGMGRTWRVGDVVLKPVEDVVEHAWVAEVYDAWSSTEVAVPQPLRSGGAWSYAGWGAHVFVPGVTARVGDDPAWFRATHESFHEAVAHLDRPSFLDDRDDAWSYGDRVAWDGAAPRGEPRTVALIERALDLMRPVDLPSQVVHGDLCVNVLRDGDRPGVIDWPAYHRPRAWALAVVAADAIRWEGVDAGLLDAWNDGPDWPQLVLRALVYRVATRAWLEDSGDAVGEEDGYSIGTEGLLDRLEERLR
jgi:uncharacterized protein (TIGR02569 family)